MRYLMVVCWLAFSSLVYGADIQLVKPLDDLNTPVVLYLPEVGKTCEVLIPVQYLYQWPAADISPATITQGSSQPNADTMPSPKPPREGTFDVKAYKQSLILDGRVVKLEFVVPDKPTTIGLAVHSFIYNNWWISTRDHFHTISVEVYPTPSWQEFVKSLGTTQESK